MWITWTTPMGFSVCKLPGSCKLIPTRWCWRDINLIQWPEITFVKIAMQTSGPAVNCVTHTNDTWCPDYPQTITQCLKGTNKRFRFTAFTHFCALSFLGFFFLRYHVYLPGCEVKECLVLTELLCFLQVSHILLVRAWADVHYAMPLTIVLVGKSSQIS